MVQGLLSASLGVPGHDLEQRAVLGLIEHRLVVDRVNLVAHPRIPPKLAKCAANVSFQGAGWMCGAGKGTGVVLGVAQAVRVRKHARIAATFFIVCLSMSIR